MPVFVKASRRAKAYTRSSPEFHGAARAARRISNSRSQASTILNRANHGPFTGAKLQGHPAVLWPVGARGTSRVESYGSIKINGKLHNYRWSSTGRNKRGRFR